MFLFILILPIVGFLITKYLSDTNLQMPRHYVVEAVVHSEKDGDVQSDTIYHRMDSFALVNQLGDTVTLANIDGGLVIVNFFQTNDTTISKPVSKVLEKLASSFARSDTGFHILSISTAPAQDSVPALLQYAFQHKANHSVWWFLNGSLNKVKNMAKTDFKISLKPHGLQNILSSPTLVLLDRFQHVRGYYNALDSMDVKRCVHDLSLLMIEKEKLNGIER